MSAAHTSSDQAAFLAAIAQGKHRKGAGRRLRAIVAKQEREKFGVLACFCCGAPVSIAASTLEHIQSQASGGRTVLTNLALSHRKCNEERGDSNSVRAALAVSQEVSA